MEKKIGIVADGFTAVKPLMVAVAIVAIATIVSGNGSLLEINYKAHVQRL